MPAAIIAFIVLVAQKTPSTFWVVLEVADSVSHPSARGSEAWNSTSAGRLGQADQARQSMQDINRLGTKVAIAKTPDSN
jgi:hypothetical protein